MDDDAKPPLGEDGPKAPSDNVVESIVTEQTEAMNKYTAEHGNIAAIPKEVTHWHKNPDRVLLLDEAYFRVVREGAGIAQVAKELNLSYTWLSRKAIAGRWMEARADFERSAVTQKEAAEVLDQAIDLKQDLLSYMNRCRARLSLLEKALGRKWLVAVGETTVVQFTDAANAPQSFRVATASEGKLSALLSLQKQLLEQVEMINKISGSKITKELKQLERGRRSVDRNKHRGDAELLGMLPPESVDGDPSPPEFDPGECPPNEEPEADDNAPPDDFKKVGE